MSFNTQNLNTRDLPSYDINFPIETRLYQNALFYAKDDLIRDYNYMIDTIIPGILKRKFVDKNGNIIDVKSVAIKYPRFTDSKNGACIATPKICRDTLSTYECDIYIDYIMSNSNQQGLTNNEIYKNSGIITKKIGSIHCMVNSNRCYTSKKPLDFISSDEWKMFLCEGPESPGCFFINKGNEKFNVCSERLCFNMNAVIKIKGDKEHIEARMTCLHNSETSLVRLEIGKHLPNVKVMFQHLGNKHYPLYLTIFFLCLTYNNSSMSKIPFNIDLYEEMIANFADEEYRDNIKTYLQSSKLKFKKKFMRIHQNGEYEFLHDEITNYAYKKLSEKSTFVSQANAKNFVLTNISENVPKEIFNGCSAFQEKLANLFLMVSQMVLCAIGLREFSQRDSWGVKGISNAPRQIARYVATTLVNSIKTGKNEPDNLSLGKGDKGDGGIIEARKCTTLNESYGERDKINVDIDPRAKAKTLREVAQSQLLFICPVKTPEGETCGLSKEKSALMHQSLDREYEENRKLPISDLFEENILYFSPNRDYTYYYLVAFVDVNKTKHFIHISDGYNTPTTNIFFSKRIINHIKPFINNKQAEIYVDDEVIYIMFNSNYQFTQINLDTWCGLKMVANIPSILYLDFQKIVKKEKNPEYNPYSSIVKSESCCYKFILQINNEQKEINIISTDNQKYNIYISELFIATIKKSISKSDNIYIEGDTCYMRFNEFTTLYTFDKLKHWTELQFDYFSVPSHYVKLFVRLFSTINDYMCTSKNKYFNYAFTFNGNVLLSPYNKSLIYTTIWFDGPKVVKYFKQCRKNGLFPMDCCIQLNEKDKLVQFYDDPGRVMAPLLVVDESDGQLVIDKLNSWDKFKEKDFSNATKYMEELYQEGCIEMIDAKEMDTIFLAESIQECRRIYMLRKFLNSINITQLKSSIIITPEGKIINEDIVNVIIHGIKFDVEFVLQKPHYAVYTYNDYETTYYGTYTFNLNTYTEYPEEIYRLVKPINGFKRDGMYMVYFKDNNFHFITHDEDLEFDGNSVFINNVAYKVEYVAFKKNNDITYRNKDLVIMNVKYIQRPDESLEEKEYYIFDNVIYTDVIDNYFINHNGIMKIADVIKFPAGKNNAYFELNHQISERKLEPDKRTITKINEYIPINIKPNITQNIDNINEYDSRECSFYMSNIRRYCSDLDKINFETDPNQVLDDLKENISEFGNRTILKKLKIYLNTEFKFTHAVLDPNQVYSVIANFVPKADSNPGPRHTYQCAMGTQALGTNNSVFYTRYETTFKRLISPKQHLFETVAELPLYQVSMPVTENMVVAILAHRKGFEDPVILSRSAYEKFGVYDKEICIEIIESRNSEFYEHVTYPVDNQGNIKNDPRYRHLDITGLPKFGSYIKSGDCIVGKMKAKMLDGKVTESSYFASVGDEGVVTDVRIIGSEASSNSFRIITIKLKQYRHQQPGDKMASRYSQKGTIADIIGGMILIGDSKLKIIDDNEMPFVRGGPNHGMRADIVFNPCSFPSRMTCGLIKEILTTKAAYFSQEKVNATNHHELNMEYYTDQLFKYGMDSNGNELLSHSDGEIMIDQTTGMPFQAFVGTVAYQFLKHHVVDKIACRYTGDVKPVTKQPVHGRDKIGGQRLGEMERDELAASGSANILYEKLILASDAYTDVFCNNCKNNSSMSNLDRKICHICGVAGELVRVQEPCIYSVFCLQLYGLGCGMLFTTEPVDDFELDIFNKQKQVCSDSGNTLNYGIKKINNPFEE